MKIGVVSKSTTVNRFVLLILQRNITRYFERGETGGDAYQNFLWKTSRVLSGSKIVDK